MTLVRTARGHDPPYLSKPLQSVWNGPRPKLIAPGYFETCTLEGRKE